MTSIKIFLISAIILASNQAISSSNQKYKFVCEFDYGTEKKFVMQSGYSSSKSKIGRMVFDQIDFSSKTAKVSSDAGKGDVSIVAWEGDAGLIKIHFLEKSEEFDVVFTTIFANKNDLDGRFPAAHSRHVSFSGDSFEPSNFIGYCNFN